MPSYSNVGNNTFNVDCTGSSPVDGTRAENIGANPFTLCASKTRSVRLRAGRRHFAPVVQWLKRRFFTPKKTDRNRSGVPKEI